jgi:hypothetical protein
MIPESPALSMSMGVMRADGTLETGIAVRHELLRQSCNTISIRYNFQTKEKGVSTCLKLN